MKTSSVEFISRSPTPSPIERNYRRFVLLEGSLSLGSGNEGKKRNRFEQTSRTLQRKISMRSTKDQLAVCSKLCEILVQTVTNVVVFVVSYATCLTQSGRGSRNSSWQGGRCTPVVGLEHHTAKRRFVEWAQNEIAVAPDFHKQILFNDEAHFWLNGYVNKQNCRIWSEANPQVYVETPLHPEKLTVWCALWAGGILQKR
ncbi:putative transposable element [Trichonephila clavipes]|nr:putative transposable element [Trichonephila clavipes]